MTVEGKTQKPISQNKVYECFCGVPERQRLSAERAQSSAGQTGNVNNREKHLQQDRTRVNDEMDLAEKPILAGYSLLDVCIRCAMLYLAVLGANENKLSGGSTEAQCGSQQQRDAQTVLL